ncbi:hypothetical protein [Azonexus hydrophilus]|jgi:hypothetical protein|uniref:hypothetical protein n=1 Tax=Azonexus hydrophilus TaxID=418702 RepID=UPI001966618B|nr:hypothetical protein [Azonexus hydrophilus]
MKHKLAYDIIGREELASHLERQTVVAAEAEGGLHVYRCLDTQGESLSIALDNGQGIIVRLNRPSPPLDRRRIAR